MGYSNKITEEEDMLQKKFAKLRKKKKQLQQLRQSKSTPQTPTTPQPKADKRPAETSQEEARELAKKVLAAQQAKHSKPEHKEKGFKRSRILERKLCDPDKPSPAAATYKPYNASGPSPRGLGFDERSASPGMEGKKDLYSSFVRKGTLEDEKRESYQDAGFGGRKRGNTIYVYTPKISEEMCKQNFSKFGAIAHTALEQEKNCAFITFESMDDADKAVEEMNGNMVNGLTLKVALARRQPSLEAVQNNTNSPWTKMAGGITKTRHKDHRDAVVYDDPF